MNWPRLSLGEELRPGSEGVAECHLPGAAVGSAGALRDGTAGSSTLPAVLEGPWQMRWLLLVGR